MPSAKSYGTIYLRIESKNGEPMGRLWGTSEWVPHTGTPVNKGDGGMLGLFRNKAANVADTVQRQL